MVYVAFMVCLVGVNLFIVLGCVCMRAELVVGGILNYGVGEVLC